MRCCPRFYARCKHGQKAWSPNATGGGAAPATGITAQEALQVAYRPLPPEQTVEYEEDFGSNMIIHREFIAKKFLEQMSHNISSLAYSDLELRKNRQQLADVMNRERRGVLVGDGGSDGDRVYMNVDVDNDTREVLSARYLFNEKRMLYCNRFQEFFRDRIETAAGSEGGETQYLFSLMEACAVVYGCDTVDAQETYYRQFLRTDLNSLAEDTAAHTLRVEDGKAVAEALAETPDSANALLPLLHNSMGAAAKEVLDAVPDLFEDPESSISAADAASFSAVSPSVPTSQSSSAPAEEVPVDHASIYKAFLAHARGESPIASYDVTEVVATESLIERRRWRALMEKLVREDFHLVTAEDLRDAAVLNSQLHTVKFMEIKVGDTVREIVGRLQRDTSTGAASSAHRSTPLEMSASHPERRV